MRKWIKDILNRPINKRQVIYALMIVIGAFFAAAAIRMILSDTAEDTAARVEYEQLREAFPEIAGTPAPVIEDEEEEPEDEEEEDFDLRNLSLDELASINKDFIGWINAGNTIDYPVVRGSDNSRYINITFFGSQNSAALLSG